MLFRKKNDLEAGTKKKRSKDYNRHVYTKLWSVKNSEI